MFLDDERYPIGGDWVIVRNFAAAVNYVCQHGFPRFVSFDNDLGNDLQTGYDFAKWLIERDLDMGDMPDDFDFYVHSQNPVGVKNINSAMRSYLHFKK
ncbi:MAG: hypothetical protein HC836_37690 [Richelia sp. RM2_1_2]|nr:hypothetical protein [Richelia sp. RM2_1_2]